jgi:CheY-like chemotaxis protein
MAEQQFDAVLMDVHMPVMDGLEATRLIREQERKTGGHVPIIALTALAIRGDAERCLAAGMDSYLAKPYRREDLLAALSRIDAPLPSGHERG